jgi:hypothetical protein
MGAKRVARFVLVVAALAIGATLARRWPREQVVHYVLGDGAPRVEEVDARWAEADKGDDWARETQFRYARGQAPRVVTHEPRLPNGDYSVEIDVVGERGMTRLRRRVTLGGGVTAIDLATALR